MPSPHFPSFSPWIKNAFKWVKNPAKLEANSRPCKGLEACRTWVLTPQTSLPPFQALAMVNGAFGNSIPTGWKVYDHATDALVTNLDADIDLIQLAPFSGPDREYLLYYGDELTASIPLGGPYYAVIETAGGNVYSEPFKVMCGRREGGHGPTFMLGDWEGKATSMQFTGNAPVNSGLFVGQKILDGLGSGQVWTWDGDSWSETAPTEGMYYYLINTQQWQLYFGGAFGLPAALPVTIEGNKVCWTGRYAIPVLAQLSGINEEQIVTWTGVYSETSGAGVAITFDGDTIHTFTTSGTASGVYDSLAGTPTFEITPTNNNTNACLTFTVDVRADACFDTLRWTSPCNIGTQYYGTGFENVLYLDPSDMVIRPTPEVDVEDESDDSADAVQVFATKTTSYTMQMKSIPSWLMEALTEIPLHAEVYYNDDRIRGFTPVVVWPEDEFCRPDVNVTFRFEDQATSSNCCDEWTVLTCPEASGSIQITSTDSTDILVFTTGGFFSVKSATGEITTIASEVYHTVGAGTYCIWSSNEFGVPMGAITIIEGSGIDGMVITEGADSLEQITLAGGLMDELDLTHCPNLAYLYLDSFAALTAIDLSHTPLLYEMMITSTGITDIDLSGMDVLNTFHFIDNAATSLDLAGAPNIETLQINASALLVTVTPDPASKLHNVMGANSALNEASVDAICNACDATFANGTLDLSGGANAAPTAASLSNRNACAANGWSIATN